MKDIINKFISNTFESSITIPWVDDDKKKATKTISFSQRYSFYAKRAIKDLIKEFWADNLWGNWVCSDTKECGVSYNNTLLKNGRCIRCGSPAHYINKIVTDPNTGFTGHVDAIVYNEELNGYLIVKINAKNNNVILSAEKPYESEITQITTLATVLQKQICLPIVGRVILWVGKPKPTPYKAWVYKT